jgi:hypothetical protein
MVAPEPGEPLPLYVMTTTEAISMVMVVERPEPHPHKKTKVTYAAGSGSLDPGPTKGMKVEEADGFLILEAPLSLITQVRSHVAIGS